MALDRRFAASTRSLDKSYWKFWAAWCDLVGTPTLRTKVAANTGAITHPHRREVALALGGFMSFVADNPNYNIDSMLAHIHGLKFVSLSMVVMAAEGMLQEHIDANCADSLAPAGVRGAAAGGRNPCRAQPGGDDVPGPHRWKIRRRL